MGFFWPLLGIAANDPLLTSSPLLERPWFEARSPHFVTFSCGSTQEVARLAARLEQFRQAYSVLAGTQAVASPPVVVMAFPDQESLRPFLPLYQDRPANLAAFFVRGMDENLIVTSLSGLTAEALDNVFHEYAHLLLRRNDRIWPMWLKEGMADVYATFEVSGNRVRIGRSRPMYTQFLKREGFMPLATLLEAGRDSPEYNERERQGVFYAQSWLLTHYLMLGGNAALRAGLADYTRNLRSGQQGVAAFTNSFRVALPALERHLKEYMKRPKFDFLELPMPVDLTGARMMHFRALPKAEVCFRLGSQLFRIDRGDAAGELFAKAKLVAPGSPLGDEGLGLLAADREQWAMARRHLEQAIAAGSRSYLAHYVCARERLREHSAGANNYTRIQEADADGVRTPLRRSLALMPDFGPAHHLLGFLEVVQRRDLASAEKHLRRAHELEPENEFYLFSLAQVQVARRNREGAVESLRLLTKPFVDAQVRAQAEQMLASLEQRP